MGRNIVILLGHPGAGKGTQARSIMQKLQIPQISTGDMLREAIANKTPFGCEAKSKMDAGELVSDAIVNGIVADRIQRDDCKNGFILDGYPRTAAQVGFLDDLLAELDLPPALVVALTVQPDELIRRLVRRSRDSGRSDDTEDVIRERQAVYLAETRPLLRIYRERGVLREVDGTGHESAVEQRVDSALATLSESVVQ